MFSQLAYMLTRWLYSHKVTNNDAWKLTTLQTTEQDTNDAGRLATKRFVGLANNPTRWLEVLKITFAQEKLADELRRLQSPHDIENYEVFFWHSLVWKRPKLMTDD